MASILQSVLGGFTFMAGVWGLLTPPVLVLFEPNSGLAVMWIITGAFTLVAAIFAPGPIANLWMRCAGLLYLSLAILGISFEQESFNLFRNTTPINLLHLGWSLAFFWDGFVSDAWSRMPREKPSQGSEV